jgi:Integrase core domain
MSRTGSCLDNAVAEAWFASLKVELVDRAHYRTRAEARASIFGWIAWYNRFRLHSTNGSLPPAEWEHQHATSTRYHRPRPHNPGVYLPGRSKRLCRTLDPHAEGAVLMGGAARHGRRAPRGRGRLRPVLQHPVADRSARPPNPEGGLPGRHHDRSGMIR